MSIAGLWVDTGHVDTYRTCKPYAERTLDVQRGVKLIMRGHTNEDLSSADEYITTKHIIDTIFNIGTCRIEHTLMYFGKYRALCYAAYFAYLYHFLLPCTNSAPVKHLRNYALPCIYRI